MNHCHSRRHLHRRSSGVALAFCFFAFFMPFLLKLAIPASRPARSPATTEVSPPSSLPPCAGIAGIASTTGAACTAGTAGIDGAGGEATAAGAAGSGSTSTSSSPEESVRFPESALRMALAERCSTVPRKVATLGLISGTKSSAIVEQHAAAGSPDAESIPFQNSFPTYAFASQANWATRSFPASAPVSFAAGFRLEKRKATELANFSGKRKEEKG